MPAPVTETLLTDVVLIFIPFRASIQVMIGLFPLRLVKGILFLSRIFVGHEQGFSGFFRSYNSVRR